MPISDIVKAKLLFVDDDQSFLDFVKTTFEEFSRNQWEMTCATDAAQALTHLRGGPVDLAMLDMNMPNVDGLQLLRMLKREFPAQQMAFLSGQGDEKSRRIGLEEGAAMFLEKPASLAGMESLFATINELARWQQRMGGRSVVRRAGLLDLVKMECKSKNSRIFEVFGPEDSGQIWVKEGTIVHALAPDKRGQSAFTHLVCLANAEFHLIPFTEPIERSVTRDWEFLVLEATRVQEQLLNAPLPATEPTKSAPADTAPTPATAVVPASPPPVEPPARVKESAGDKIPESAPIKFPQAPPIAVPAPPPAPVAPEAVFSPIALAPVARPALNDGNAEPLQILELLVTSERREVLYEWECGETQRRMALIDFIGQKAKLMVQTLPLGKLDRVEFQGVNGRLVVQLGPPRNVIMRSNTKLRPGPAADGAPSHAVTEWLALQAPARGLYAFGIVLPDRKMLHQSFAPDYPLSTVSAMWPAMADMFDAATRMHFPSWQARWIYERAQVYATKRSDGTSFGVLLAKDPQAVHMETIEMMFEEFKTLRLA